MAGRQIQSCYDVYRLKIPRIAYSFCSEWFHSQTVAFLTEVQIKMPDARQITSGWDAAITNS